MSNLFKIPTYATGSFNYLRRAAKEHVNGSHDEPETATVKLDVAIAGAGIGGLAASIALARDGHSVTIYENAPALGEVGLRAYTRYNNLVLTRTTRLAPESRFPQIHQEFCTLGD
jgi:heterodisulfide reductase subunit A-like polyferredoxin